MPNKMNRPDKSQSPAQPQKREHGEHGEQGQKAQQGQREQRGQQGQRAQQGKRDPQGPQGPQGGAQQAVERDGTERARDQQRQGGGPRYGGGAWNVADERGDRRFGHARNDDADPSELAPGAADNDDDESPSAADPELAAAEANAEIESGGQRAGFGRGEEPRKSKSREK